MSATSGAVPGQGSLRRLGPLLVAIVLFAAHAALFGGWIVDDAGITFAYARDLAQGYGVVAQPGVPPVEGYSNPSWMLVTALAYALRVFVLPWTPKLIAFLCAAAVLTTIWRDLERRGANGWVTGGAIALLACCSGFTIWVISGLENALLACLAALSARFAIDAAEGEAAGARQDLAAGAVAALLALTRPDAVLYAGAYPIALLVGLIAGRTAGLAAAVTRAARMAVAFVAIFGGYLAFRFAYFGDWVPNTFHAKVKPGAASLFDAGKLLDLVEGAAGDFLFPVILALAAGVLYLAWRRALRPRTLVLGGHLALAAAIYMLMPMDWMGEFRFATPFFVFFFWFAAELVTAIGEAVAIPRGWRTAAAVAGVVFVAQAVTIFAARSLRFAEDPTVPLSVAARFGGEGFNSVAAALPEASPSLLTPDLGGVLLHSRLRVYDLAGLCDPVIARTLGQPQALRDYVFGQVRPTFIHTQGAFTRASALHLDPRFARDYLPLHEAAATDPDWARIWRGQAVPAFWGDYVRRDAVPTPEALQALQDAYRREGLERYRPWVRPPDRLRAGWPQVRWALSRLIGGAPGAPVPSLGTAMPRSH